MTRAFLLSLGIALAGFASSAAASDKYAVKVDPATAKIHVASTARITLTPGAGLHVNTDAPISLTMKLPAGVEGVGGKLAPSKKDKSGATFDVAFTAHNAGDQILDGTLSFVMCNDAQTECVPGREKVQIKVAVK